MTLPTRRHSTVANLPRGQLQCWIGLEHPGPPVPDGLGGFTQSWEPLDPPNVWAWIQNAALRDLERLTASATVIAVATHLVTIDYHPQVTVESRVTYGLRQFEIRGINNQDEANVLLVLTCAEILRGVASHGVATGADQGQLGRAQRTIGGFAQTAR